MNSQTTVALAGHREFKLTRRTPPAKQSRVGVLKDAWKNGMPHTYLSREVNVWRIKNIPNLFRGLGKIAFAQLMGIPVHFGRVYLTATRDGKSIPLGVASYRVVTTAGVNFIVDAFQASATISNMKYHGFGTGTTAEAITQTALITELTTEYASNNTRPTGTQTEGATANIYRTVGTLSPDATVAITEHGIFDQAANSGGTLLDRTVFSAWNMVSGDSLAVTYDVTFAAGS